MSSTFGALEIGLSSLQSQQIALNVTGQNITNANTPGYYDQSVTLTENTPVSNYPGQLGSGVTVAQITQSRNAFVDQQLQNQQGNLAYWQNTQSSFGQVQAIYNEPSTTAISSNLSAFFSSLQSLANNPQDLAVRTTAAQQGQTLATSLNTVYNNLQTMQTSLSSQVPGLVNQINGYATQIATLNQQITTVIGSGQQPNDLISQRASVLNNLSNLVNIQVNQNTNGAVDVVSNGGALVAGDTSLSLGTQVSQSTGLNQVVWSSTGSAFNPTSGQLAGSLNMLSTTIPAYQNSLNTLASNLSTQMNALQSSGYALGASTTSGLNFFNGGTSAATITVNPTLLANPNDLAAATTPNAVGDGSNALKMANLTTTALPALGNATLSSYYGASISNLGLQAQQANQMVTNSQALVTQLTNQQQSVSGVSLDQEATNLVRYQQAYSAAGQFISAINTTLNTLIQTVG